MAKQASAFADACLVTWHVTIDKPAKGGRWL